MPSPRNTIALSIAAIAVLCIVSLSIAVATQPQVDPNIPIYRQTGILVKTEPDILDSTEGRPMTYVETTTGISVVEGNVIGIPGDKTYYKRIAHDAWLCIETLKKTTCHINH